jgi:hypothetical protein
LPSSQCRYIGSPYHCVDPFTGAIAAIFVALCSSALLPQVGEPTRWGSRTTILGRAYPTPVRVDAARWAPEKADELRGQLERLCEGWEGRFRGEELDEAAVDSSLYHNGHGKEQAE